MAEDCYDFERPRYYKEELAYTYNRGIIDGIDKLYASIKISNDVKEGSILMTSLEDIVNNIKESLNA